jgi:hypothetical protein
MQEPNVDELLLQLSPELPDLEQCVRDADPGLTEAEVLDRALQLGLSELRRELSLQTFDFLKHKVEMLKEQTAHAAAIAETARFASAEARRQRAERRAAWGLNSVDNQCVVSPYAFHDHEGNCWTVHEVDTSSAEWSGGRRCLIFSSETAIRRVWRFPVEWRRLAEAELEALSWAI